MEGPIEEIRPNVLSRLEKNFLHNWYLSSYLIVCTVKQLWTSLTSSLLQNITVTNFLYIWKNVAELNAATYPPFSGYFLLPKTCKPSVKDMQICDAGIYDNLMMTGLHIFTTVFYNKWVSYHQWSSFSENCCLIKHLSVSPNEEWDTQVQGHGRGVGEQFFFSPFFFVKIKLATFLWPP